MPVRDKTLKLSKFYSKKGLSLVQEWDPIECLHWLGLRLVADMKSANGS
jgi:hypothetical protein